MQWNDSVTTRRAMLKGLSALGMAGPILGGATLLPAVARAQGGRGGHLKVAFIQTNPNESFDPLRATTALDYARLVQLYDTLTEHRPDYTLAPRLAQSWESTPDAKTWRFNIRSGVTFHDGKPLTGNDVVFSLRRHMGGKQSGSVIASYFESVTAIEVEGEGVVRIDLSAPNADFPAYLGDPRAAITRDGVTDYSSGTGTGPFKVGEFRPGISSTFVRNENYWQADRPLIDSVEQFGISDVVARTNALLSGEVHIAQQIDPKTVEAIDGSGRASVVRTPSGKHYYFAAMCDRAPTDNLDLRLALKYLVDRERMLKTVSRGLGQVANDHPVPPSNPWYNKDIPLRQYDPERAAFHLKKAGIDRLALQLHTSAAGSAVANDASLMYQQMVAAAGSGLTIDVIREPVDGFWSNVWQHKPFVASGWTPRPTIDIMFTHWYLSTSTWNDTAWKNERLDTLVLEGRKTLDEQKRREIYDEMQLIVHEDAGNVIPVFEDLLDGVSTAVEGFVPNPNGPLGNYRFAETVSLKA